MIYSSSVLNAVAVATLLLGFLQPCQTALIFSELKWSDG